MKRRLLQLTALLPFTWTALLAAQTGATQPAAPLSPQEVFQRVSPSVFVVEALDSQGKVVAFGSGVAVAPNQVVTNQHVVEDGIQVRVRRGQQTWMAVVTHANTGQDLCRLRVEGLQARPAEVRNSVGLAVGERVYAIGAPQGLELTFSEGVISALRNVSTGRIIQTTAPISEGSSGGGLFDARGKLVGVTTLMLLEGQNLNFALPGEWIAAIGGSPVPPDHSPASRQGNQQALLWFVRGFEHDEKGEYDQAIQAWREAIRLKPDDAEAWHNLGVTYRNLQQHDQALQAYREAIRLKPDLAEAWNNLGNTYGKLQQNDQAIRALREAIRLQPDYALAWNNLGYTYHRLARYDQAIQACREAIRLKPDLVAAWNNLGNTYGKLRQNDQAIRALREAIRLQPDYVEAWYNLGNTHYQLQQNDQAIRAYREAIRLQPDPDAWYNLGTTYTRVQRYDQAIQAYREAIRLKPDYAAAWNNLGVAYSLQGNRSGVMQVYERLKKLDPELAAKFFNKLVLP